MERDAAGRIPCEHAVERRYRLQRTDGTPLPLDETPLFRAVLGETVSDARWLVARDDGTSRMLVGSAAPLRTPEGVSAGVVLIARDETDRVAAEAERERLLVEAQRTHYELERASRLKDEFLAMLSHELRTPLNERQFVDDGERVAAVAEDLQPAAVGARLDFERCGRRFDAHAPVGRHHHSRAIVQLRCDSILQIGRGDRTLCIGSTARTAANVAARVERPVTANAWADRVVTVAAFWVRPIRTIGSTGGCCTVGNTKRRCRGESDACSIVTS